MNEPIVLRTSLLLASLKIAQTAAPPIVVVSTLAALNTLFGIEFSRYYVGLAAFSFVLSMLIFGFAENKSLTLQISRTSIAMSIFARWLLILAVLLATGYATQFSAEFARRIILTWSVITPFLVLALVLFIRMLVRISILSHRNQRAAVIAGVNEPGLNLAERLEDHPELCMKLIGFFDDRGADRLSTTHQYKLLGPLTALPEFVLANGVDVIFVALPIRHVQRVMDLLEELRDSTASIYFIPDIFVFDLIQSRTADIRGLPVVAMCETPFYGLRGAIKRLMDIVVATIALVATAPIMLLIALSIRVSSRGPILFRQKRYGLDGKEIIVYKFRTMFVMEDDSSVAQATREDARVTPLGRFLRRYSLDELPQLINVLQGRMSLVGPRPHAVSHNEEYRKLIRGYMVRHKVLPGITGLAQVNGCRGETAELSQMESRINYDLDYLRHWTPLLDVKILFKTISQIFRDPHAY